MVSSITHIVKDGNLTLREASSKYNIPVSTLKSRMFKNELSLEDAIFNNITKRARIIKGDRFGHLVATGNTISNPHGNMSYEVVCDCGNIINVLGIVLKSGKSKTACNMAGCSYSRSIRHGVSKTKEHNAWINIKQRCYNKDNSAYPYYGGIGITMSDEFLNDVSAFLEHIGKAPSPTHSVDRIDGSKGYERGNLKWSTKTEQSNNQRRVNDLTMEIKRLKDLLDVNDIAY